MYQLNLNNEFDMNKCKTNITSIKFWSLFTSLAICLLLTTNSAFAAKAVVDISGDWDSKYGVISLKVKGVERNGDAIVTGTYKSGNNSAPIVFGRLVKRGSGNTLKIEYYMPWKPLYGYGEFGLDSKKGLLRGKYFQAEDSGEWVLTRRGGGNLITRTDLPLVTKPKSKRASMIFPIEGDWDSNFGRVKLEGTSLAVVKQLKGSFKRQDGKEGKITFGTFIRQPGGGILKIKYYCPWNKASGKAEFRPDKYNRGRMLLGRYDQNGQYGVWILCRPANFN